MNAEFQRIVRRDKKSFLNELYKKKKKKYRKTIELERLETSSRKQDIKGTFNARTGMIKDRNSKDLTEAEKIKKWQE